MCNASRYHRDMINKQINDLANSLNMELEIQTDTLTIKQWGLNKAAFDDGCHESHFLFWIENNNIHFENEIISENQLIEIIKELDQTSETEPYQRPTRFENS